MDAYAEKRARDYLRKKFMAGVQVVGEETLNKFTAWGPETICVLLDMIDGTDFFEMAINLWCSAALVYDHQKKQVLGAVVGLATGEMYYAHAGADGAVVELDNKPYATFGTSGRTSLRDARVAFFGQKPKNFLSVAENASFLKLLRRAEKDSDVHLRIHGFAGNPMIARLGDQARHADGIAVTAGIDAVFDIKGQQLHDVLPGAYIAKKAGAYFCDLDGKEIGYDQMGEMMADPRRRIRYVLAATPDLGRELASVLRGEQKQEIPTIGVAGAKKKMPQASRNQMNLFALESTDMH